jgi:DNA-binding GntR family transcriptional regulator
VVTQAELGRLVYVSRTTLVQILQQLERNGLIEQGYRTLRVRDASALEAIAAQV